MYYLLILERFKIYIKIQTNIAPTCFGLQPPQGACTEPGYSYVKTFRKVMSL
jgi:hypothetical protein